MELEKKYRAYLVRQLRSRDTPIGRLIVGDAEMGNWVLPIFPAGFICWAFSLSRTAALAVLIPALAISLIGAFYVLWVRIKYLEEWRKQPPNEGPK